MFIHFFGAVFGLIVGLITSRTTENDHRDAKSDYSGHTFAFLGSAVLFVLLPSFNAAFAVEGTQYRVIFNTILCMMTCCVTVFSLSHCLPSTGNRFGPMEIHHASLAGGIVMGAVTSYLVPPVAAVILGVFSGIICVLCYLYVTPLLNSLRVGDTAGVFSLHGVPGLFGALIGLITVAISESVYVHDTETLPLTADAQIGNHTIDLNFPYGVPPSELFNRSGTDHAAWQTAILGVTILISVVGSVITGLVINAFNMCFSVAPSNPDRFHDNRYWHVPADYPWDAPYSFEKKQ